MRLIERTITSADDAQVPVSLCGQMGADVNYTMLLLGMGLREWSVPPSIVPEIKEVCRSVDLDACKELYEEVMEMDEPHAIDMRLRQELKRVLPENSVY